MKKVIATLLILLMAGSAWAANVPSGYTGLWRFQNTSNYMAATLGSDATSKDPYSGMSGPWTQIGTETYPTIFSDGGVIQTTTYNYLSLPHNIAPNGGAYVNQYTILLDYCQTSDGAPWDGNYYSSLYQTNPDNLANNDGDLFIKGPTRAQSVIGTSATGYSANTFDASQWHRYVISVDNGNFFRVYLDGTLYLDGTAQSVDGRFSLDPTVLVCADNDGEEAWGLLGTVATWNHALSGSEVAGMGGWIGGSATPTALTVPVPEPSAFILLAIGAVALIGIRMRKRS